MPRTGIYVDCFVQHGGVYVLTHAHVDHMRGLCVGWRHGFLHCTCITAKYLTLRGVSPRLLRIHELEKPFTVDDPQNPRHSVTGTFVDASHCAGAVIVVFEGLADGPVVNTGDFRYYDGLRESPALQRVALAGRRCQKLCLDVSWAHDVFSRLPTKAESIGVLLDLLDRHYSARCFLHSHGLGDEELLAAVATHYPGEKLLFTNKHRFEEIKIADPSFCESSCTLLAPDVSCPDGCRVIIVANSRARHVDQRLKNVQGIEVSCSTLWWARRAGSVHDIYQPVHDPNTGIHHVLWAMHSSLEELRCFVDFIRPQCIHPICPSIVGELRGRERRTPFDFAAGLFDHLDTHDSDGRGASDISAAGVPPDVSAAEVRSFFRANTDWEVNTLARLLQDDGPPTPPRRIAPTGGESDGLPGPSTRTPPRRIAPMPPSSPQAASTVVDSESESEVHVGYVLPVKRMRVGPESPSRPDSPEVIDLSPL